MCYRQVIIESYQNRVKLVTLVLLVITRHQLCQNAEVLKILGIYTVLILANNCTDYWLSLKDLDWY